MISPYTTFWEERVHGVWKWGCGTGPAVGGERGQLSFSTERLGIISEKIAVAVWACSLLIMTGVSGYTSSPLSKEKKNVLLNKSLF